MSTRIPSPVPSPSGAGPTTLPFSRIPSHSLGNASTPGSGIPTMERQLSHGSPLTTPPSGMAAYSTPGSGTAQHKGQQHAHDMRESGSDDLAQSGDRVRRNSSNTSLSLHPKTLPPAPGSSGRPPTASSLSSLRQRDSGQPSTPRMQSFVAMHGLSTTTRSPATASAPGSRIASGGNSPVPSTPVHTQSPGSTFYSAFAQSHGSQALPPMPGATPPSEDRWARASLATGTSGGLAGSHVYSSGNNGSSNIMVTVRMRPLSDKERARGDHEVWGIDSHGNVGQYDRTGRLVPKYHYDTVFGPQASNRDVYDAVAAPLIRPALEGINGTVFAYGVTSSGKTHTMLGTDGDPGILPSLIGDVFAQIEACSQGQGQGQQGPASFSVRLSMMEIYNEVLNDLLEPSRGNLKVFEDASRGMVVVEGLAEEVVGSAHAALSAVWRGEQHRKVGCTAMNEDSSRSHTLCRLVIEGTRAVRSSSAAPAAGSSVSTATLCLIDLAGSESAKATVSRGQRMEGAYINKSLLTLGTVIHKLAAGQSGHVPFRDSKLTRLLQNSMAGPGARIAIVCNITPAAAQAEETANTLKFATRAKLVRVSVSRNEVLDDAVLVRLYRSEIMELKRQVAALLSAPGSSPGMPPPLLPDGSCSPETSASDNAQPSASSPAPGASSGGAVAADVAAEVRSLQQQLERERAARQRLEREKAMLEQRLRGLTHLMLDDSKTLSSPQGGRAAAAVAGVQAPGAARGSPPGVQPPRPRERTSAPMRASESNIPLFSAAATAAAAATASHSTSTNDSPQHRRSRSDMGVQLELDTASGSSAAAGGPAAGPLKPRISLPGASREPSFSGQGVPAASGAVARQGTAAEAPPPAHGQRHGHADEEDDEVESEALLSTIMAMQEELNDGGDSAGRASSQSHGGRARHLGKPPLSQAGSGSPPQTSGGGAATPLPGADSGGLRTAGSSVFGDCEKDLEIQVLLADREVLQDQIVQVELHNEQLSQNNDMLRMEVQNLHLEREKARRMLRELEGDMIALRTFKNQTHAELEALTKQNTQLQATLAATKGAAGGAATGSAGLGAAGSAMQGLAANGGSALGGMGDVASLPALQQQLQQLGTGGALVELRQANPGVYQKVERLEQQINAAISGAVARNMALEAKVATLQREKQALMEAARQATVLAGQVASKRVS